jgi:hypothetical protein
MLIPVALEEAGWGFDVELAGSLGADSNRKDVKYED